MCRGGVALVVGKAPAGVKAVELDHRLVASDLRHDARRHDRCARAVAPDDRHLRQRRLRDVPCIDEQILRRHLEPGNGARGGEMPCLKQAEAVDLRVIDGADRDGQRAPPDEDVDTLTLGGREELRVAEPREAHPNRQAPRPADHRSGERAHADLIDPGHHLVAHRERHALVAPQLRSHLIEVSESRLLAPTFFTRLTQTVAPPRAPQAAPDLPTAWGGEITWLGLGLDCLFGFRCRCSCLRRLVLLDEAPALADAGVLAHLGTQVVEPALAHIAMAQHIDLVDARRVDHESSLDADAVSHAPHGEVHAQAAAGHPDHGAFEHLDALACPFHDLGVHSHRVAGTKGRHLFLLLLFLELLDHVHVVFNSLVCETCLWAACWWRHCRMRAWSPERRTSGTLMPRYSAGRVYCGHPEGSVEKLSCVSDSGSPTTPGTRRATASIRTIAGISPPLRT